MNKKIKEVGLQEIESNFKLLNDTPLSNDETKKLLQLILEQMFQTNQTLMLLSDQINNSNKDLMNLDEACEFLKLGKARMYTLVRLKQIKHSKLGNRLWFSKNDLIEMINQKKQN